MSLPAHDTQAENSVSSQSVGATRMEQAQERFNFALERMETALSARLEKPAVTSAEDDKMIGVLREEIEDLRQHNAVLSEANKTALSQVELTIGRLKGAVEN
ncbi:MAG: hypothetical protein HON65_04490 [Rhodospirillales bacterium]|jgi:hypothetical protein|nr:hypothetical protein [Rhodospirillales bacterium]